MKAVRLTASLALLFLTALGAAAAAEKTDNPLDAHVRAANSRFEDVKAVVAEGYSPIRCTSGIDGGAMDVQ